MERPISKQPILNKNHHVILVPGLLEGRLLFQKTIWNWRENYHIVPEIYKIPWFSRKQDFISGFQKLLERIDFLSSKGKKVSLIGVSAGGSAVLNAFCERPEKVSKVICICSPLKMNNLFRFKTVFKMSNVFKDSLLLLEDKKKLLSQEKKEKILLIRPLFDELVPLSLMEFTGAKDIKIISMGHLLSINTTVTVYSNHILKHLLE